MCLSVRQIKNVDICIANVPHKSYTFFGGICTWIKRIRHIQ